MVHFVADCNPMRYSKPLYTVVVAPVAAVVSTTCRITLDYSLLLQEKQVLERKGKTVSMLLTYFATVFISYSHKIIETRFVKAGVISHV